MMKLEIEHMSEPMLEFGYGQQLKDPKDGLFLFGPLEDRRPSQMRVGVIGTPRGIAIYRKWLQTALNFIPLDEPGVKHRLAYPGFEEVFHTKWPETPIVEIGISATEVSNSIRKTDRHKAIYDTVSLFADPIVKKLNEDDSQVDVWFVVIPDEIWRLGRPLSRPSKSEGLYDPVALGPKLGKRLLREPSLFAQDQIASEPYRYDLNFHHQLKARLIPSKAVVQVVRESSLGFSAEDDPLRRRRLQDPASLAWNLTTTAFFKAGGRPWKLANIRPGVCYVGLVFKINELDPDAGNACCGAQMFLDSGDGLVFKSAGPWYSRDRKEFFLTGDAACELISRVVIAYSTSYGSPPSEIFVHGRKRFTREEWAGFKAGLPSTTNLVCVRISRSQELKLYRPTKTPVMRGSAYIMDRNRSLLWTSGYIPELATYPGREVPNPLLVEISYGDADIRRILADIMGLTKVNFNACIFSDGLPVTLRFADAVGEILTAAPLIEGPPLPFRHYI